MDIITQKFRFSMLIHEHGHGVMVAVFQQWSPGLMNDQQLISFSFTFQSPEQELEIMSISSLLSFLFSLTVKNNSVPQVIHWTHCLLEQGCGFLGYKKVLVLNVIQMCFKIFKMSMKVLKRSKSGIDLEINKHQKHGDIKSKKYYELFFKHSSLLIPFMTTLSSFTSSQYKINLPQ